MLIQIGHGNMTARRWPIITIGLILFNIIIAFLTTKEAFYKKWTEPGKITANALYLAASHPDLKIPRELEPLIREYRSQDPDEWAEI